MKKSILLSLVILAALSGVFYLLDVFYFFDSRQKDFTAEYRRSIDSAVNRFHRKFGSAVTAGDYNRLFLTRGVDSNKLSRIIERYRAIDGIILLDSNGHIIASNSRFQADINRGYLQASEKSAEWLEKLTPSGWLIYYPVFNYNNTYLGHFVIRYNTGYHIAETATALYEPASDVMSVHPPDYLSRRAHKKMQNKLKNTGTGSFDTELDGQTYHVYSTLYSDRSLLLVRLVPQRSLTAHPAFWVFTASFLALFFYLTAHSGRLLDHLSGAHSKQRLREVLDHQRETLQHLEEGIHRLRDSVPPSSLIDEHLIAAEKNDEVPGFGEEHSGMKKTAEAGEKPGRSSEAEPVTITLEKSSGDYIFLDIDETVHPEPEKEKVAAEKSEKAFTPEVKNLINEIKQAGPEEKTPVETDRISRLEKMSEDLLIPKWTSFLNELYFDDITDNEMGYILKIIAEEHGATGGALLNYHAEIGCFSCISITPEYRGSSGNLFLLQNDPYFKIEDSASFSHTLLDENRKSDPFISKRFNSRDLQKLHGTFLFSLADYKINGFLFLFFEQPGPFQEMPSRFRVLQRQLRDISPAIQNYVLEKEQVDLLNQTVQLVKEIKMLTHLARRSATILHLHLNNSINDYTFEQLYRKCMPYLYEGERIVFNSPTHLVFMLEKTETDRIMNSVYSILPGATAQKFIFPDLGKNYYSYI